MKKLILASKSPRRKELLSSIYPDKFLIVPSDIDEEAILSTSLEDKVVKIALAKLKKVQEEYPNNVIIASDTIVVFNNKPLGKPKDEIHAFNMLKELSGNVHEVFTSYAIISESGEIFSGVTKSKVYIESLTEEEIKNYLNLYKPFDKAGSYGIQDAGLKTKVIEGRKDIVMGFPTQEVKTILKKLHIITK